MTGFEWGVAAKISNTPGPPQQHPTGHGALIRLGLSGVLQRKSATPQGHLATPRSHLATPYPSPPPRDGGVSGPRNTSRKRHMTPATPADAPPGSAPASAPKGGPLELVEKKMPSTIDDSALIVKPAVAPKYVPKPVPGPKPPIIAPPERKQAHALHADKRTQPRSPRAPQCFQSVLSWPDAL